MEKTIILGKNKTVKISSWKGKTKKDFVNIFRNKKEKITEQDVVDILLYPYIDNVDQYYSSSEIQYMLTCIREISIKDDIVFSIECDNIGCKKDISVVKDISEMYTYTPSKYPVELNEVKWVDLRNSKSLETACKKFPNELRTDIELMLHIESINGDIIHSFEDILEICNDLDIQASNDLADDFISVKSQFNIGSDIECPHCGSKKHHSFDIIPAFFDPILPKDI